MMQIFHIARKNLLRKKTRSLLTVMGIALAAWVLVTLFGFNQGYEAALNKDIDNMGFQVLLAAKGCPYEAATLMLKGGTGLRYMEQNIVGMIEKDTAVDTITPMLMQVVFDPNKGENGGFAVYQGVDPVTFPKMKPYLQFQTGGWFADANANEAVFGYEAAELEQRELGDLYLIPEKEIEVKVVGVLKRNGTQDDGTIFLPLGMLQKAFGVQNKLTGIGIKVKKEADINKFEERMYLLPDIQVVSMQQVKNTIMTLVSTAKVMVFSIAFIAILIALVGVINTVLMSVIERRQELGILKSMGALAQDIFQLITWETLILCLSGGLAGSLLAILTSRFADILIRHLLPYSPTGGLVQIRLPLVILTLAIVVAVGLLSGIYPSWKAARIRPLESIRSEVDS